MADENVVKNIAPPRGAEELLDPEDLYETDPELCKENIVVSAVERPMILPKFQAERGYNYQRRKA